MSVRLSRRPRVRALAAVIALTTAMTVMLATPAQAAPSPRADAACPDAYPVANLHPNQPVSGLTVSSGTTPDTFTGTVLGVIPGGIAPGLDMIIVSLTSDAIDAAGVWAGMSGSPVYAADGRLIGAVSYGLTWAPSPVAGVTPAADMKALLNGSPSTASARPAATTGHVVLPQRMQQRLVSAGLATPSEASAGLDRLPLPMGVSGAASQARLGKVASRIPAPSPIGLPDVLVYPAAAAPAAAAGPDEIVPGGNLAASISYGDFTAAGIGTATMVCDGQVVGFGHPFDWTGDSTLTMHGADVISVLKDEIGGSYKLANLSGPVGGITGDHGAGISGPLAKLPAVTDVHGVATLTTTGNTRTGDTYVSVPEFLPDVAAFAQVNNQDRVFDRFGPGSSLVHFTVDGSTPDGKPFTLARTNRFASSLDISGASDFEAADDVYAITSNNFTDVTITDVRISTQLSPDNRIFSVGKIERKIGTSYTTLTSSSVVKARARSTVTLRVTLNSYRNRFGTKTVMVYINVPVAPVGSSGSLTVSANADAGSGAAGANAKSFDDLLAKLAGAPRNDQLRGEIDLYTQTGLKRTTTTPLVRDVVQGSRTFQFRISS